MRNLLITFFTLVLTHPASGGMCSAGDPSDETPVDGLITPFEWSMSEPLLEARATEGFDWHAIKDPTVVQHQGRWHLFATMRGTQRSHTVVYTSFTDWKDANTGEFQLLKCHDGFFCAPQVFFHSGEQRWYLICQAANEDWGEPPYRPAFSITSDVSDPASWSPLQPLFDHKPDNIPGWLDFWVIFDDSRAWLFFTSLNGQMWRSSTHRTQFPFGWSRPELALEADVFEASHTYRLKGVDRYLTIIEAQNGHGFRYFKAYLASSLGGEWTPLAATKQNAFASLRNVTRPKSRWTDAISHGELLRCDINELLEIDPGQLQMVFQGATNEQRRGKRYGEIPWRLGRLRQVVP